jgi:hypothetical protein
MYASVKGLIWGSVPAGGDATEILLGYGVFLITLLVFRRPSTSWWAALPTVILGAAIALLDVVALGQGAGPALRDLVLFALLPVAATLIRRMGWTR